MLHSTSGAQLSTKIRNLGLRERNKLTAILSISHSWKDLAAILRSPDNPEEYIYSAQDIDTLDMQPRPAEAFLEHWSTYGLNQPNLSNLLEALKAANLLRAVHFVQSELLKISDSVAEEGTILDESNTVLNAETTEIESRLEYINKLMQEIDMTDVTLFPFDDLCNATGQFCEQRIEDGGYKLGEGSYGAVYRASISSMTLAVKVLKEAVDRQFFTELKLLVRMLNQRCKMLSGV